MNTLSSKIEYKVHHKLVSYRFIKISKIHYSNLFYKRLKIKIIRRKSLKPQICLDYFVVQIYYFF